MAQNSGHLPSRIIGGESIWIAAANTAQSQSDIIIDGFTPAAGYTLAYQFASATPISVSAVANGAGTGWTLELTGAQTLMWTPGKMYFAGIASLVDAGPPEVTRTFAVNQGSITVDASPMRIST